nr:Crp/Fnr family transcriptional regulator [Frankia sp. ACN1ag]
MPVETRAELLKIGSYRTYADEEVIMREGDRTNFSVLLLNGWVKVTAVTENGGFAMLSIHRDGDLVGELEGLDAEPRMATVTAAGDVLAKVIQADMFVDFLRRRPEAHQVVSSTIGAKLRSATRRRIEFGGCTVAVRLARVILELERSYGTSTGDGTRAIFVSLTQPELAALVSAAEPAVHKALRELRQRRILESGYRTIIVHDIEALQHWAYP